MSKNEVTTEDLADKVDGLASNIDDLARMTANGFSSMQEQMDKRFDAAERRLDNLEQGQLDIKLRLDNVAHRFELCQLEKRVDVLEQKAKLA